MPQNQPHRPTCQVTAEEIRENHVAISVYFASPEDARRKEYSFAYFGVFPDKKGFRLWSVDDDDSDPYDHGHFATDALAVAQAHIEAQETGFQATEELQTQQEGAWAAEEASAIGVEAPFEFWDSANYTDGRELKTKKALFKFLEENHHFDDTPPSNGYSCSLTDSNGVVFWVRKGPNGEFRMVAVEGAVAEDL